MTKKKKMKEKINRKKQIGTIIIDGCKFNLLSIDTTIGMRYTDFSGHARIEYLNKDNLRTTRFVPIDKLTISLDINE